MKLATENVTKIWSTATTEEVETYEVARHRFEVFAAIGDDPDGWPQLSNLERLQIKLMRWERSCFGLPAPIAGFAGIVEEVGELMDDSWFGAGVGNGELYPLDRIKWVDAIGDILVFSCNLATKRRLSFDAILNHNFETEQPNGDGIFDTKKMLSLLGKLGHVTLKANQKIRGYENREVVRRDTCLMLTRIVSDIALFATWNNYLAYDIMEVVAKRVMERDWTAARGQD